MNCQLLSRRRILSSGIITIVKCPSTFAIMVLHTSQSQRQAACQVCYWVSSAGYDWLTIWCWHVPFLSGKSNSIIVAHMSPKGHTDTRVVMAIHSTELDSFTANIKCSTNVPSIIKPLPAHSVVSFIFDARTGTALSCWLHCNSLLMPLEQHSSKWPRIDRSCQQKNQIEVGVTRLWEHPPKAAGSRCD